MKYLDSLLFCRHDSGEIFVYYKGIEVGKITNNILSFEKNASLYIEEVKKMLEFNFENKSTIDYQI